MHSIRTKITLLTLSAVFVSIVTATVVGAAVVGRLGNENTEKLLLLTCQTGEKDIDYYLESVEQSVEVVSHFLNTDLSKTESGKLDEHIDKAKEFFEKTVAQTEGVLTYYYRIDPTVSVADPGFWYINVDGLGFKEHEVTDITQYDTADTSKLVWFTVPKNTGKSIWLLPYYTDNLGAYVISYNIPIYWQNSFLGVVGIEISYYTISKQVDAMKLYDDGYGFLTDKDGNLVYHPRINGENKEDAPKELLTEKRYFQYENQGVARIATWMPLHNEMKLFVSVPVSEINGNWQRMILIVVSAGAVIALFFALLTFFLVKRMTDPLRKLTLAASSINDGNYDVELSDEGDDEIGVLTKTVSRLATHLKGYISDLNSRAFEDALTSARNKGAFDMYCNELQRSIDEGEERPAFGMAIFDCDDLKTINDVHGHDKGDIYLKSSYALITSTFVHSPVFRIGGDEFAVLLQKQDLLNREALKKKFEEKMKETLSPDASPWEKLSISMGLAIYDPNNDRFVSDVTRRADRLMYDDKRTRKANKHS